MIKNTIFILSLLLLLSCNQHFIKEKSLLEKLKINDDKSKLDTAIKNSIISNYFINGKTYQNQNKFDDAIFEYQEVLKYDSSIVVLHSIAECFYNLGKLDFSENYLIKVIEKDENYLPSLEILEKIYYQKYDLKRAIVILEKIVKIDSKNDYKKLVLGNLYEFEDENKAIEIYKEIKDYNYKLNALTRLSELYLRKKNYDKHIKVLEELIELNYDDNSTIFFNLLNEYNRESNYEKSFKLIDKYNDFLNYEEFTNAFYNIGINLLNDSIEKLKLYTPNILKIVDSAEYKTWYLQTLGLYISDKNNDTIKLNEYLNSLKIYADSIPEVALELAHFYEQKNNIELSQEILLYYAKVFNRDLRFYFGLASLYHKQKKYNELVSLYKKAKQIDSNNVFIMIELGLVYNILKDYQNSDKEYLKAIEIEPKNPLLNNNFAYSLSERGIELEKAENMIKIALEAEPNNPSYLDTYAWILFKMGNYNEALKYSELSIKNNRNNSEVYEHLGDILIKLNKKEEAIEAYKEGLRINPNFEAILEKLNNLIK